ncbi:MAG: FeoB-associated Cys-rich membrane protein [bacterium]|nr:FeoB-associated Cys-rich membrane protein [bacterium]
MNFDFQSSTAIVIVVAAVAYLARAGWLAIVKKESSGCGSCAKCPSTNNTETTKQDAFIPIESLLKSPTEKQA